MPQTLYPWRPSISLPEGSTPLLVIGIVSSDLTTLPHELANRIADLPAFTAPPPAKYARSQSARQEAELRMHIDHEHGVVYIVLMAPAGGSLLAAASALAAAESEAAVHGWLTDTASERALIVLFHLCQVILVTSCGRCADVRLLRTLRLVTSVRQALHPTLSAALKSIGSQLPPPARKGGPPLIPTLGFVFSPLGGPELDAPGSAASLRSALETQTRGREFTKHLEQATGGGAGSSCPPKEPAHCVFVHARSPPMLPRPSMQQHGGKRSAGRVANGGDEGDGGFGGDDAADDGDAGASEGEVFNRLMGILAATSASSPSATAPATPLASMP